MTLAIEILRGFSALSFSVAGVSCLGSQHMEREFERYGLSKFRRLTGVLQLAGAAGLIVGLVVPLFTTLAAGGLGLLMLLGVAARLRVNDSWAQISPAGFLSISNFLLVVLSTARA